MGRVKRRHNRTGPTRTVSTLVPHPFLNEDDWVHSRHPGRVREVEVLRGKNLGVTSDFEKEGLGGEKRDTVWTQLRQVSTVWTQLRLQRGL